MLNLLKKKISHTHTTTENHFPFLPEMKEVRPNLLKRWVLNLPFVTKAIREAEIQAFPKAQKDILETMNDEVDKKAEELAQVKLASLLSNVDLSKLFTMDKKTGLFYIGGKTADDRRLSNLKNEAEFLLQSDLWQVMYETTKELASRQMFVAGESLADMQKGKSILYTLDSQKKLVEKLGSYIKKMP